MTVWQSSWKQFSNYVSKQLNLDDRLNDFSTTRQLPQFYTNEIVDSMIAFNMQIMDIQKSSHA